MRPDPTSLTAKASKQYLRVLNHCNHRSTGGMSLRCTTALDQSYFTQIRRINLTESGVCYNGKNQTVRQLGVRIGDVLMMNKLNNADRRIAIPPFRKRQASKKFYVHLELGSCDIQCRGLTKSVITAANSTKMKRNLKKRAASGDKPAIQ